MAHMFATEALKILRTMRHFVIMDYDGLYREHVQTTDAASQITAVTANMSIFPTFFMFGLWCPSPMAIHASMRGSRLDSELIFQLLTCFAFHFFVLFLDLWDTQWLEHSRSCRAVLSFDLPCVTSQSKMTARASKFSPMCALEA